MKNNLIGISGKIGSGKDTVAKILLYLNSDYYLMHNKSYQEFEDYFYSPTNPPLSYYYIKRFADILKIGLECDFPTEFSRKLWETQHRCYRDEIMPSLNMTRRKALVLRGDALRQIHQDYFVNSLLPEKIRPQNNLIIPDVRYQNEAQRIKDKDGIVIRVNKSLKCGDVEFKGTQKEWEELVAHNKIQNEKFNHPSETSLDDYEFDYTINNNGTIEELMEKIKLLDL